MGIEQDLGAAIALFNGGDAAGALRLCDAIVRRHAHPGALQLQAVLLRSRGSLDEALQAIEASLRLRPDHGPSVELASQLCHEVGRARHAAGDMTGARQAFERCVALVPTACESWFALALVQQDLHALDEARHALLQLLALHPQHGRARLNLGIIEQQLGSLDDAMRHFGRANREDPSALPRILGALSSERCGCLWLRTDQAVEALQAQAPALSA
ncbi:tetratricopeptide repeat protein [Piscinibacter terrae]|uniref:Uncharacterized protein n=1 Tax=Piscinibacter terrae TaxID=2496871 RepID=A0A3N7JS10_9BURK|nr:tetratricopeptide repeat protein [Albitalea terrae]RQP23779.1 hypothetical protein DZC73_16790 [Albitalea terrae]